MVVWEKGTSGNIGHFNIYRQTYQEGFFTKIGEVPYSSFSTYIDTVANPIVMAYKELPNCESANMQIAMGGRLDILEFARSSNYRLARFLDKEFKTKAMTIPPSYPLYMSYETKGTIGDVSLRHAAVAAGF
jgi:hypothetical protein